MTFPQARQRLETLIGDNIHGASYLDEHLVAIFKTAARQLSIGDFKRLIKISDSWSPPMGNILNTISFLKSISGKSQTEIQKAISERVTLYDSARVNTIKRAASLISKFDSIATISYSGLVADSIIRAYNQGWRGVIVIPESRPMNEGKLLAAKLSSACRKSEIIFITDMMLFSESVNCGSVFIGADLISDTYFVNKIGTGALVSLMPSSKQLFVVADTGKYYRIDLKRLSIPDRPASEIWQNKPGGIKIVNRYFEPIKPKSNIKFVNEFGVWLTADIKKYLDKRRRRK